MPRPRKWRKVCFMPDSTDFGPINSKATDCEVIVMTVDEYEAIRLIDVENMSQEECAERMNVARTTVQRIYTLARKKLAESLVHGYILKIEGGDFELCSKDEINGCACCRRDKYQPSEDNTDKEIGE